MSVLLVTTSFLCDGPGCGRVDAQVQPLDRVYADGPSRALPPGWAHRPRKKRRSGQSIHEHVCPGCLALEAATPKKSSKG